MPSLSNLRIVVLAGGSGTRLWPLSRLQTPKQFIRLLGNESLLEATISRLGSMVEPDEVVIVTNEETATGEGYHVLSSFKKILEPVPRNTAPAIGIAALRFLLDDTDPVMVVLPSDHLIRDTSVFQAALRTAIKTAHDGALVTFGIAPHSAETGFGYMKATGDGEIRAVESFHEKPDRKTAESFLSSGNYYWNSGMFVWRASAIRGAIKSSLPQLDSVLDRIETEARRTGDFEAAIQRHFADCPSISIDHGVLEKSGGIRMVTGNFGWSDVGSWDAVYEISEKDEHRNAFQGNVVAVECRDSLIRSQSRLVAAVDVEGVSVIETPDAVLVTRRGAGQNVRKLVEELARRAAPEHVVHTTVQRPWGSYTVLEEAPSFKIKRIEVRPGGRLSLQRHRHRSEHWVVIAGEATVTCDTAVSIVRANESSYIPIGAAHRLENRGAVPLQIIEVQVGTYVGEDDIERLDDQYGRVREAASKRP